MSQRQKQGKLRGLAALALAILVLATFPVQSRAQQTATERSAVVVIDPGEADLLQESLVRTTAESHLQELGYKIIEGAKVGGDTPARLLACSGALPCSQAVLAGIPSQFVFFVSLRADEGGSAENLKIVVRNFRVSTGEALGRVMKRCETCQEEVNLGAFTEGVLNELLKPQSRKGQDTDKFATDKTSGSSSGDSTLVSGLASDSSAQSKTGSTLETTTTTNGASAKNSKGRGGSSIKYLGLGLGAVAVGAGTALVLLDGPQIENGQRQPDKYDTLHLGFASLGVGAALIATSLWLWSSEDDDNAQVGIVPSALVPTSNGAMATWGGRF